MKEYYINFYRNFANTYHLYYIEKGQKKPEGFEKITREKALKLARQADEYGSNVIIPLYGPYDRAWDYHNDSNYQFTYGGRIIEKIK